MTKAKTRTRNQAASPSYFELQVSPTNKQKAVHNFLKSYNISILTADAGCGKTHMAVYHALTLLKNREVDKIIIAKPLVEVGSSIGFLPGTEQEKESAYMDSYIGIFSKLLTQEAYRVLLNAKKIEFKPVNYSRGSNYENAVIIMDEAQGLTLHEIFTFTTRVSDTSKLIILGDPFQSDIKKSGLLPFIELCKDIDEIGHMSLGDDFQMRNQVIVKLYKNYKKYLNHEK